MHQHANSPDPSTRFHSLDGVRASMMLLGIFFHAAWFFVPVYFGHPITDRSANWGFSYFFYWVHTFRMQAFFLIAGFFACLLIHKRGVSSFIRNRLLRVALPFVVFTILLFPLMQYQSIVGGLQSGRIQSSQTAWQILLHELSVLDWKNVWPVHLWFLECLLLVYGISLVLWGFFQFIIDRQGTIRQRVLDTFSTAIRSRYCLLVVSFPVAGLLFWASGHEPSAWYGIDSGPLKPKWNGVFAYWIFFAVGWCLYQRPELLRRFDRGWQWRVLCGSAMAIALCAYCNNELLVKGRVQWMYPFLGGEEIRDYASLKQQLLEAKDHADGDVRQFVWNAMSPEYQEFIERTDQPDSDQMAGIGMHMSLTSFTNPELADPKWTSNLSLPAPWQAMLATPNSDLTPTQFLELNRKITEAAFSPVIASRYVGPFWLRITYFSAYALTTWLLVFGTLGFFNQVITQPSPAARYIADSSYWLYLIHLPIQFQIQLWIAQTEMFWLIKYTVYMVLSFAVMLPTYHFLVRSTWLGVFLNGRKYPFVGLSWPLWERIAKESVAASIPSPHFHAEQSEAEELVERDVSLTDRLAAESGEA